MDGTEEQKQQRNSFSSTEIRDHHMNDDDMEKV